MLLPVNRPTKINAIAEGMIGNRPEGMIFPRGNVTPGIQLISTVSTPTTEAAIALLASALFQTIPPTKGTKHAAARKE